MLKIKVLRDEQHDVMTSDALLDGPRVHSFRGAKAKDANPVNLNDYQHWLYDRSAKAKPNEREKRSTSTLPLKTPEEEATRKGRPQS